MDKYLPRITDMPVLKKRRPHARDMRWKNWIKQHLVSTYNIGKKK